MEASSVSRGLGLARPPRHEESAGAARGPGQCSALGRVRAGLAGSQAALSQRGLRLRQRSRERGSGELPRGWNGEGGGARRGAVQARAGRFGAASAPRALSLGFTSDPRISVERNAARLLGDAASLLVYQNALKGPQAQALLRLLLVLSRGDDQLRLLEAYGEFYRKMLDGERHASWQDCLLEAILGVEDCPFAEASARASSPTAPLPPHLLAAAKADLAALQRLALTESTLVSWVCSSASEVAPEWRAAAESPRDWAEEAPAKEEVGGSAAGGGAQNGSFQRSSLGQGEGEVALASLERAHVRKWREELGGQWAWHSAVDMLQSFYWSHGYGAPALFRLLTWCTTDKKLVSWIEESPIGPFAGSPQERHEEDEAQEAALKQLLDAILCHSSADGQSLSRVDVLLCGPPGTGKTRVLRKAIQIALQASMAEKPASSDGFDRNPACLRFVEFQKSMIKSLPTMLTYMGGMPQLRFVLCADDLSFKPGDEAARTLRQLLDGSVASDWPCNVMLLATSRDKAAESVRRDFGPLCRQIRQDRRYPEWLNTMFHTIVQLGDWDNASEEV